jgi:hypothetical protein
MALKMIKMKRLPEGADRFMWNEFPVFRVPVEPYARILKFDPSQPRDPKGTTTGGQFARGSRSPLEQKRRDFQALLKREAREEVHLNHLRVDLLKKWTVWSEEIKNRKKPLKPDGAAAKKLDSYKEAKALEDDFHRKYNEVSERQRKFLGQAHEMLKVPSEMRSKVMFTDNPQNPLHPGVSARTKMALQVFRAFDGSGAFEPVKFPAEKLDEIIKIFGGENPFVQNEDGTYSIPVSLKLSKATSGRANADIAGVNIAGGNELERQVYHEVAHHIEMRRSEVLKAAIDFRERQANTPREVYKLNTIKPGLEDDEIAVRGNFLDPYTGKIYREDIATEIVSTGVEAYIMDPVSFARNRPEHFNLIFDIMHGKYR